MQKKLLPHSSGFYHEDGGSNSFRNISNLLPDYTASYIQFPEKSHKSRSFLDVPVGCMCSEGPVFKSRNRRSNILMEVFRYDPHILKSHPEAVSTTRATRRAVLLAASSSVQNLRLKAAIANSRLSELQKQTEMVKQGSRRWGKGDGSDRRIRRMKSVELEG